MNPIFLLIRTYWAPMLAVTLCLSIVGYVGYQRHEINGLKRDKLALQQTIDLAKAVGQAQNEKTARIEQGAHQAAILSANQYLSDLEKVKTYNANHPHIVRVPVSVRQPATNTDSSPVSQAGASAEGADAGASHEVASGQSLESDCTITTLQLLHLQQFELEQQAIH